jgi:hypothetical protein
MSLGPADELLEELITGNRSWGRPNDRTAFVDAALVRVCRALDAAASAVATEGRKGKPRLVEIESAAASLLTVAMTADGHWRFESGTWADSGMRLGSTLLRPTLRGVARASRPDHADALRTLVADVDLVCAHIIAEHPGASGAIGEERPEVDAVLRAAFELDAADTGTLLRVGQVHEIGAGATLMAEGEGAQSVAFVIDGVIEVKLAQGTVRLKAGSVVGEHAVLTKSKRSATVRAITETTLLIVPAHEIAMFTAPLRAVLHRKVTA